MERDLEVLCSVILQKIYLHNKEEMTLLDGEALLRTTIHMVMISVGTAGVWKIVAVVLDTKACPTLMKKSYF